MTDAFDINQSSWIFNASPAPVLYNSTLPLPSSATTVILAWIAKPTHNAVWWERTKGFDFSQEDRVDPEKFNRVIWQGLMGQALPNHPTGR